MTTFHDARAVVERELGPTLPEGLEDARDYCVSLRFPDLDDQVNLVDKVSGELHREIYFEQEDRLMRMTPVSDLP